MSRADVLERKRNGPWHAHAQTSMNTIWACRRSSVLLALASEARIDGEYDKARRLLASHRWECAFRPVPLP